MNIKVIKFGGSSLANANNIRLVKDIINLDELRKIVVVSAPGKRFTADEKITDLLYAAHASIEEREMFDCFYEKIENRFLEIARTLNIKLDILAELDEIKHNILDGALRDYAASRGEYLMAKIMADYMDCSFLDAEEVFKFNADKTFNYNKTIKLLSAKLKNLENKVVIPGFYGSTSEGKIVTFTRGGSDFTGAIVANAVSASMYENFTDVDGFLACEPKIIKTPHMISELTYRQLRELSCMGAQVLHPDSVYPASESGIPINIKNTFNYKSNGTLIVSKASGEETLITGITGKKRLLKIVIEKPMLEAKHAFLNKLMKILKGCSFSLELIQMYADTVSIIVDDGGRVRTETDVISKFACLKPKSIRIENDISLVAIIGQKLDDKKLLLKHIFSSLSTNNIIAKTVDYGNSDTCILIGVTNADFEKTSQVLYNLFFNNPI